MHCTHPMYLYRTRNKENPSFSLQTDIMDSMAGTFNYTWSVAKQSEEDWGVTPKDTGDGLQAHDYVGVLVSVVYASGVPNLWVVIQKHFTSGF